MLKIPPSGSPRLLKLKSQLLTMALADLPWAYLSSRILHHTPPHSSFSCHASFPLSIDKLIFLPQNISTCSLPLPGEGSPHILTCWLLRRLLLLQLLQFQRNTFPAAEHHPQPRHTHPHPHRTRTPWAMALLQMTASGSDTNPRSNQLSTE